MGKISIRSNDHPDTALIKAACTGWIGEDVFTYRYFMRGLSSKNPISTLEAYCKGRLLGLLTAWKSDFHPHCTYFALVTKPSFENEVESLLLEALTSIEDLIYPLQTSIWETSYKLKAFYEENGFLEVRRTYSPKLRISKIKVEDMFPEIDRGDYRIRSLKRIENQPDQKEKLIKLVRENYEKSHTVNPVGTHSLQTWEKLIFDEDTIQSGSFVFMKENEILAYALLHESESPDQFEFGWRGAKERADIKLMLLLTACQINFAIDNGIGTIEAEIDTTDHFQLEMLKFFPFSPAASLLTFQLDG